MVLYWLTHGLFLEMMSALYGARQFTIKKYTYIMCDVLFNVDKLFLIYVHIPTKTSYSTSLNNFVPS